MGRHVIETPLGSVEVLVEGGRLKELNLTYARATGTAPRGAVFAELRRYFRGEPVDFHDVEVDLGAATPFQRRVYEATRSIPWGKVATYRQVAKAIGNPDGQRAVGQALNRNPVAIVIPCHRVVAADGLGGFGSGLGWKRRLLRLEGVLK